MRPILTLVIVAASTVCAAGAPKDPEAIIAGFEDRVARMFAAESGDPLVRAPKRPPLGPGRGNYVRGYSWSMVQFAARCLYLGEQLDEANAALAENAQHYLDNPKDINDRDSFHWHAEIVLRLIELYGTNGRVHAGRLTPETEALALKPIWHYAKTFSRISRAEHDKSQTWHIYQSENHHAMSFTLCWHLAKIAKDRPEYKDKPFDDGKLPAAHYRAWSDYFVVYCRERARKGLFIEMMNRGYNTVLIKGVYNFYDFGEPDVRRAAGLLLDLYWAYWAQEQIDGVQGGGRSRIYFYNGLKHNPHGEGAQHPWLYFEIGEPAHVHGASISAALSAYRPPAVVADIATDTAGRGRYEVRQRPQGLGQTGQPQKTAVSNMPTRMRTDGGGILRYTYCDPAFILGTAMTEARPLEDWAAISSQNRWQGAIFAGDPQARIVPIVRPKDNRVAMNGQWSAQHKGALITQKLLGHRGGAQMIVWFSAQGLREPVEEDGLVFAEAPGAYAAVRVLDGGYTWHKGSFTGTGGDGRRQSTAAGRAMVLDEEFAPVMLQVMAKSDVASFDAFKAKVKACTMKTDGSIVTCQTIYGDTLTFDTSYRHAPKINGKPVDYAPTRAFDSPFLTGDWNSGVVTIRKGDRVKVLDFRDGK